TTLRIPLKALEIPELIELPELLRPLNTDFILLITPLMDPPTEEIMDRIAFQAPLKTLLKTPPALPAPEKADFITFMTEDIPEPAVDITDFIFVQELVKTDLRDVPAPLKLVKNPITVPTQVATVVRAGTIALKPFTSAAITGVK